MSYSLHVDKSDLELLDLSIARWEATFWKDMRTERFSARVFFNLPSARYTRPAYDRKGRSRLTRRVRRSKPETKVCPCAKPTR